jgi:hypothetical protein
VGWAQGTGAGGLVLEGASGSGEREGLHESAAHTPRLRLDLGDTFAAATGSGQHQARQPTCSGNGRRQLREQRHVPIVGDVLARVAVSFGNLIGLAIRLGHREASRPDCKPDMETATPIRGIQAVGLPR